MKDSNDGAGSSTMRSTRISGVELIRSGLRGVKVTYQTIEISDNVSYSNEHNDKRHRPVHELLRQLFAHLKSDYLAIMGYGENSEVTEADVEIIGIKAGKESFSIKAEVCVWQDRTKEYETIVITPADNYDAYLLVMETVDKIYDEIREYMKGNRKATKKQVIVDYMRIVKRTPAEYAEFEKMSDDEQAALMAEMDDLIGMKVVDEGGEQVLETIPEEPEAEPSFEVTDAEMHPEKKAKKKKTAKVPLKEEPSGSKAEEANLPPQEGQLQPIQAEVEEENLSSEMNNEEPVF